MNSTATECIFAAPVSLPCRGTAGQVLLSSCTISVPLPPRGIAAVTVGAVECNA